MRKMTLWAVPMGLVALVGCSTPEVGPSTGTTPSVTSSVSVVDEHMTAVQLATQAGLIAVDSNPNHEPRMFSQSEAVVGNVATNDAGGGIVGDVRIFTYATEAARQQWLDTVAAQGGGYVHYGQSRGAIWSVDGFDLAKVEQTVAAIR